MDVFHINDCDDIYLSLEPMATNRFVYYYEKKYLIPWSGFIRKQFRTLYRPLMLLENFLDLRRFDKLCKDIAKDIDENNYDLVLANPFTNFQSPNTLRHLKTPSVYLCLETLRGTTEFLPQKKQVIPWLKRQVGKFRRSEHLNMLLRRRNDERNVKAATTVLTNSYFSRESLYRWYRIDAGVLKHGVNSDLFYPLNLERENLVLSVGTLAPHKAHEFVIEALSYIPAYRRPTFVVAGMFWNKKENEYLKKMASANNVKLILEIEVSQPRLLELYNRARITACASIMEPFGLTTLESFACETPVVAVCEGGFRETVTHGVTGFLAPRKPDKFAEYLDILLQDEKLRTSMGKRAREEVVANWQWENTVDELEQYFTETINKD